MARINITDPTGTVVSPGMVLLEGILRDEGHDAQVVTGDLACQGGLFRAAPDAWYLSTVSVRQFLALPAFFDRVGLEVLAAARASTAPLVALGGYPAANPLPILPLVDVVALGDGEATAPALAAALDRGGKAAALEAAEETQGLAATRAAFALARAEGPFGARLIPMARGRAAVEVARGCKRRCAYCAISWLVPYREADQEEVHQVLAASSCRQVNLLASSLSDVSWATALPAMLAATGSRDVGEHVSIRSYLRGGGGAWRSSVATGIDGASERIRRATGKPITDDEVVAAVELARDLGVTRLKLHQLLGMPGETAEDLDAWRGLWARIARVAAESARLQVIMSTHFHLATPHTPLEETAAVRQVPARRCAAACRTHAHAVNKATGRSAVLVLQAKGYGQWRLEQYLMRADETAAELILRRPGEKLIRSQRWEEMVPPTRPRAWGCVDAGVPARMREAALRRYWLEMGGHPPVLGHDAVSP